MNDKLNTTIERFRETKEMLETFSDREIAIQFLIDETGLSKEECSNAYNTIMKIDFNKKIVKDNNGE